MTTPKQKLYKTAQYKHDGPTWKAGDFVGVSHAEYINELGIWRYRVIQIDGTIQPLIEETELTRFCL